MKKAFNYLELIIVVFSIVLLSLIAIPNLLEAKLRGQALEEIRKDNYKEEQITDNLIEKYKAKILQQEKQAKLTESDFEKDFN